MRSIRLFLTCAGLLAAVWSLAGCGATLAQSVGALDYTLLQAAAEGRP